MTVTKDAPLWCSAVAVVLLSGCNSAPEQNGIAPADRVLLNGAVYTVNNAQPWAEAVAIFDGHIVFVGSNTDASVYVGGDTEVTDRAGQMLLPCFHDSHTHILIGDSTDEECNLLRIESVAAVEAKLRECTALAGFGEQKWIIGSGWSDWLWPKSEPDKAILDELFPDRPVYLKSSFGHSVWVNSRALELDVPMLGEERTLQMYPIGSVHRAGGRINGASDYFVTSMNPLLAIEVGLTRQDPHTNAGEVLNPDERVDLATMIAAYTINGAYTMKLDHEQGSIEVGKRADLTVLNQNIFDLAPYAVSDAYVTMTVFDGRTVYQRTE